MAISVTCLRCRKELEEPGGLLFSPPLDDDWTVSKDHLCATCHPIVRAWIEAESLAAQPIGKPAHAGGPYNDQGIPL